MGLGKTPINYYLRQEYGIFLYQRTEKGLSPHTIAMYLQGIRHFYDMNDVVLNWEKSINSNPHSVRSQTINHIKNNKSKKMLNVAGLKVIVLLLCSTGLRLSALKTLGISITRKSICEGILSIKRCCQIT